MNRQADERYEFRARIGVGASFGAILGALLAAILFLTPQAVLIGMIIGAGLGALIGSRIKSQAFQFLWIEYSKEVGRRFHFYYITLSRPIFFIYLSPESWYIPGS